MGNHSPGRHTEQPTPSCWNTQPVCAINSPCGAAVGTLVTHARRGCSCGAFVFFGRRPAKLFHSRAALGHEEGLTSCGLAHRFGSFSIRGRRHPAVLAKGTLKMRPTSKPATLGDAFDGEGR